MTEENTPAPDAEPGEPGAPTPTPEPSAEMADLTARLEAAEAKVETFGADNQKLRTQRRELKAKLSAPPADPADPPKPAPPEPGHGFENLAITATAKAELLAQGADPKLVDLAAGAIDRDLIEVEGENIEGVAEAVTKLLKERPELKAKSPTAPGTLNGAPGGPKGSAPDPATITRKELSAMSDDEFEAFTQANPVVEFQMGDGPLTKVNISSTPNEAFKRVHGTSSKLIDKLSGGL